MIINELKKLENSIRRGEWQPKHDKCELWGGADVVIALELTDDLRAWESDNHLVIDYDRIHKSSKVLVISKYARQISALFYSLREIFRDYIDFANKFAFYGRLGKRANKYIAQNDDLDGVLLEIIDEAKMMAREFGGRLYFAYGSNMDENQMAQRCLTAKLIGKARLNDYKFIINSRGVASIIKSDNSFVEGILWSIFPQDEKSLDGYEGIYSNLYNKEEIVAKMLPKGEEVSAIVYIASENVCGKPCPGYLEKIISAANKFNFDPEYIAELESWGKANC
ncbi:AIG2-like family protein [Thermincola ferriacetica]|uniref:AIG2-like family protein n=1 Tax=Thermincola ferriacetica TaxID=281456 RepID=A0A0L6VZA0_9FIRM|nr:gamma-glutamylcyclotransferase family protein [Thermincola ferriacetica]KNZ68174.1 AIG2-like family protein [Thermincola ferriacetica]